MAEGTTRTGQTDDVQERRLRRSWLWLVVAFGALALLTAVQLLLRDERLSFVLLILVMVVGVAGLLHRRVLADLEHGRHMESASFQRILQGLARSVSPDAIVDAIVEDLGVAAAADHTVVVRLRADARILEATLVSSRAGVPSSTTMLPLSDLEDPGASKVGPVFRRQPVAMAVERARGGLGGSGAGNGASGAGAVAGTAGVAGAAAGAASAGIAGAAVRAASAASGSGAAASASPATVVGAAAGAGAAASGAAASGAMASAAASGAVAVADPFDDESAAGVSGRPLIRDRVMPAVRGGAAAPLDESDADDAPSTLGGRRFGAVGSLRATVSGRASDPALSAGTAGAAQRIAEQLAGRVRGVYGLRNTLSSALVTDQGVVGAIVLSRRTSERWPSVSKRLIQAAAEEASAALARAYSYRAAEERASTDALTGLPNRRYFDEFCGLLARRRRAEDAVGVLMIDIDHFKRLNDRFGHPIGDQVLRSVAGAIGSAVREGDVPAQFGGEEFAVLLRNPGPGIAMEVGERVRAAVAALDLSTYGPTGVTVSVGVAVARSTDQAISAIVDDADHALYRAKRMGRDRVVGAE